MMYEPYSSSGPALPHGAALEWRAELIWLHVGSDAVLTLSFLSIPAALAILAVRRPDLAYRPVMVLFAVFIFLLALTHAASIWTVWTPDYRMAGLLKLATAGVALATAAALWPLLPRALSLPSIAALRRANRALIEEIDRRAEAERALQALADDLEQRVTARTDELERANRALRQFAATASHDLQAPLRHISLFAELARQDAALPEATVAYLDRIGGSAERMRRLVGDLLEYARLVNTPPRLRALDLTSAAQAAIDHWRPDIEACGASVTLERLPAAWADPALIERVFDNLVSNALKYAGPRPTVRIGGREIERGGVRLAEISVEDDGPGVPPGAAEAVFEMLTRIGPKGVEGTGVGLAFCRTIVDSHGGQIRLEAGASGGARVVFLLPAAAEALQALPEAEPAG